MSITETLATTEPVVEVESTLFASSSYIETLTIKPIETQPWLVELVVRTRFLNARNPEEQRVKARCCIDKERLVELRDAINQILHATGSSRP